MVRVIFVDDDIYVEDKDIRGYAGIGWYFWSPFEDLIGPFEDEASAYTALESYVP